MDRTDFARSDICRIIGVGFERARRSVRIIKPKARIKEEEETVMDRAAIQA